MKRLYLLRHAKADQPERKLTDDHGRPLAAKGQEDCPLIGDYLKKLKADFTHVLCSDSLRTRQTASLVLEAFGTKVPVEYSRKLYHATTDQLLDQIREVDDSCASLLLVGHNPGLHELAIQLADDGKQDLIQDMLQKFPPASLAIYRIETGAWLDIKRADKKLLDFTYPKKLEND